MRLQSTCPRRRCPSVLRFASSPCADSSEPPDARITKYSERIGEHWIWRDRAPVNVTTGYPRLKIAGKYEYVHIVWWEHVNGPRPVGEDGELLTIDHKCEFGKRCVAQGASVC